MKRYRLIAAVGAVASLTAVVERVERLRRVERIRTGKPDQDRRAHAAHGELRAMGLQVRAGAALAVNEINRSGGVKGRGQGRKLNLVVADDQSTNTTAAIDGFRRLTQQEGVVSVGGIIGSADRAGDDAARRGRRRSRCSS